MPLSRTNLALVALLLLSLLSGCQAGYVLKQSIQYLRLKWHEVRIEDLEASGRVGPETTAKLRWVRHVLEFSKKELGLEPGDSYQTYLDMGGKPISHIVTAAHPLALIPYLWSFPLVGQVPYKGYFDEADALKERDRLREKEFEALVMPAGAFSTLKWFRDPILSTMLEGSVADLADLLIHETTHRTLYFPGRSSFNESLATYMARKGTELFLSSHDELRELLPQYLAGKEAACRRELLLLRLRNDLDALYRSPLSNEEKRNRKAEIFKTASAALEHPSQARKKASLPLSNAFVLSVARYHEFEPLLSRLDAALGGKPSDLIAYLKKLPVSRDPVPIIEEALSAKGP